MHVNYQYFSGDELCHIVGTMRECLCVLVASSTEAISVPVTAFIKSFISTVKL